ncbi:30S ribosomal protein S18 [Candidatus Microgenomates bacterium]|jgi:small subunit ribosomal protein S18|nr:30S ribosomal protein S18 [Candidatus Microgenomates bacterium]
MDDEIKTENIEIENKVSDEEESFSSKKKPRRKRKIIQNLKCPLCESGVKSVTYKDVYQLKKFTSVRGKIISTEKSGVCDRHQRQLTNAVKRARFMALLPYASNE